MSGNFSLYKLYVEERKSTWEIAKIHGVSQSTIMRGLRLLGIPRRTYKENKTPVPKGSKLSNEHRQAISKGNKGKTAAINPVTGRGYNYAQTEFKCTFCGNLFLRPPRFRRKQTVFCNIECRLNYLRTITKEKHPNYDCQSRQFVKCNECGKNFLKRRNQIVRSSYHFCSRKCNGAWKRKNLTGDKIYNFKGGYDQWENYGPSWPNARWQALERDGHKCQICGITAQELDKEPDVHHVIPFRFFGLERHEKANRLSNLQSLCPKHHTLEEVKNLPYIEHAANCVRGIHEISI